MAASVTRAPVTKNEMSQCPDMSRSKPRKHNAVRQCRGITSSIIENCVVHYDYI